MLLRLLISVFAIIVILIGNISPLQADKNQLPKTKPDFVGKFALIKKNKNQANIFGWISQAGIISVITGAAFKIAIPSARVFKDDAPTYWDDLDRRFRFIGSFLMLPGPLVVKPLRTLALEREFSAMEDQFSLIRKHFPHLHSTRDGREALILEKGYQVTIHRMNVLKRSLYGAYIGLSIGNLFNISSGILAYYVSNESSRRANLQESLRWTGFGLTLTAITVQLIVDMRKRKIQKELNVLQEKLEKRLSRQGLLD